MKKVFLLFIPAAFIIACSENNSSKKTSVDDLVQLENDWMHAMMKRDQSALEQLVAPEFTVAGMKYIDTPAVTRNMWMFNTMNDLKIDSVHFIKIKSTTINDVGIIKALFYWSGTYDDNAFSDSTSFVDTWLKRNGEWRVISRIITD